MTTANTDPTKGATNLLASPAATDEKKVEVQLSGFMTARIAKRLGLGEKDFKPGDKVKLARDDAAALIAEGGVAVNPADDVAVKKILGLK